MELYWPTYKCPLYDFECSMMSMASSCAASQSKCLSLKIPIEALCANLSMYLNWTVCSCFKFKLGALAKSKVGYF